ncbi:MAG: phosphoglycerate dehydrogenase [Chitinophagales bacterium]|nr:phosphoglycerate dehydrogenase [Chitinophagales bacterium]
MDITSFPKEKIKVLLLENISPSAKLEFEKAGYSEVEILKGALNEDELIEALQDVRILGIRSKTQITERVLKASEKLMAIGCFCIGTNQVDLESATSSGVTVFNAPFSNTRSVAELVIASTIMLIRRIPEKNAAAHQGLWLKESDHCHEIRGKKLGIIGYGHIGSQVSVLAEALGLEVYYYDIESKLPLGNANTSESMENLIEKCDILTLHVPSTPETVNLFNKEVISKFRKGQYLINMSRGNVVDLDALKESLEKGILAGAAIDVFPVEPKTAGDKFVSPLQNLANVLLTPHIGGSTEEAQWNIGLDVSSKLIKYLENGSTIGSHSLPELSLPKVDNTHRILHIHHNVPGVLSEINKKISDLEINILGQYLSTNKQVGYVVLDVSKTSSKEALEELRLVSNTINARILY